MTNALGDRQKALRIKFTLKAIIASVCDPSVYHKANQVLVCGQSVYHTANQVLICDQSVYHTDYHIFTIVHPMVYFTSSMISQMANHAISSKIIVNRAIILNTIISCNRTKMVQTATNGTTIDGRISETRTNRPETKVQFLSRPISNRCLAKGIAT